MTDYSQRLLFLCPDERNASGGVRKIYEFASDLRAASFNAVVVHRSRRFRPTWFDSDVPVVAAGATRAARGDVVVVPDIWGDHIPLMPGVPKIVLNQNHFFAQDRYFTDPTVLSIVVVSLHGEAYCQQAYPSARIERIRLGTSQFSGVVTQKAKQVAYMPRRGGDRATPLLAALQRNGSLQGWRVVPIAGQTAEQVAATLAESAVFLSFSRQEGLGLPPLEAMAAGCLVIGYHGQGGREFFDPSWSFPVEDDDNAAYLAVARKVLCNFDDEKDRYFAMGEAAARMVRKRYTMDQQAKDVVAAFTRALSSARGVRHFEPVRLPRISRRSQKLQRAWRRLTR